MTADLAAWLLDQIARDGRDVEVMKLAYPTPWELSDRGWMVHVTADAPAFREVVRLEQWEGEPEAEWLSDFVQHVVNWNPDRVIADCEAKRRIIEQHSSREVASLDRATWAQVFVVCRTCCVGDRQVVAPCPTLRLLAVPMAGRAGYREEWRL